MTDFDRSFVRIAEGQVHLRQSHGGQGKPLLMLHASPSSSRSMVPLMEQLAGQRRLIAPDSLGNGSSPAPAVADPDIGYFADAASRVCDALGIENFDVYGTHTGAHIAVELAIAQPHRVGKIILDGVAVLSPEERAEYLEHYAPVKTPSQTGEQFHWAWHFIRDQMIFYPYYRKDEAHLRAGGRFDAHTLHDIVMDVLGSLTTYHMPYHAVFRQPLAQRLAMVGQKTLCVTHGDGPLDPGASFVLEHLENAVPCQLQPERTPIALGRAIAAFLD